MGELELTKEDKFIVLASDGIWEFLKNIDVARIIHPFYLKKNAEGAAESLVREAFKRWKKEEDVIDDITCIVIFLDVKVWSYIVDPIYTIITINTIIILNVSLS